MRRQTWIQTQTQQPEMIPTDYDQTYWFRFHWTDGIGSCDSCGTGGVYFPQDQQSVAQSTQLHFQQSWIGP